MNTLSRVWLVTLVVLFAPLPVGVWLAAQAMHAWWRGPVVSMDLPVATEVVAPQLQVARGMVRIPAGRFVMGDARRGSADQRPAHSVVLDAYWVDQHLVTNAEFRHFVDATGYRTTAEGRGWSLVFDLQRKKWLEVQGASWQHPSGPRSTLVASDNHPVVHVSWNDAMAYAAWAGKRLLTEAEYEHGARGGLLDTRYVWGDRLPEEGAPMANYWQGRFPSLDRGLDGFRGLAPVGQFPVNRFGLADMAGNVWCWCHDWYDEEYYVVSDPANPRGPSSGTERVLRGGSWLSTAGSPDELAVANRGHALPEHAANNIGFRCATNDPPPSGPTAAVSGARVR